MLEISLCGTHKELSYLMLSYLNVIVKLLNRVTAYVSADAQTCVFSLDCNQLSGNTDSTTLIVPAGVSRSRYIVTLI